MISKEEIVSIDVNRITDNFDSKNIYRDTLLTTAIESKYFQAVRSVNCESDWLEHTKELAGATEAVRMFIGGSSV